MLFKHNLIFFLIVFFATSRLSKVSVEVCVRHLYGLSFVVPFVPAIEQKLFGDLTEHLQDSRLMNSTKVCNSTARTGRQKARQQTAKEKNSYPQEELLPTHL